LIDGELTAQLGGGAACPSTYISLFICGARMRSRRNTNTYLFMPLFELVDIVISKLAVLVYFQSEHFLILVALGP
jgi:hypothetical protein